MTIVRARVEANVPKKRPGAAAGAREKAVAHFFDLLLQALLRGIDFATVKVIVIASPGFVKDEFYEYLLAEAARLNVRPILDKSVRFILAHASGSHKASLADVIASPAVFSQLADTRAATEVAALNAFFGILHTHSEVVRLRPILAEAGA